MTFAEHMKHLFGVFGPRNTRIMPTLVQRLVFLTAGIRLLEDACEEEAVDEYSNRLASVFARLIAVLDLLTDHDTVAVMSGKYGGDCSYCEKPGKCGCPRAGRQKSHHRSRPRRHAWTLRHWQTHLGELYGDKNRARGLDHVLLRLFSESSEAMTMWLVTTMPPPAGGSVDVPKLRAKLVVELCDVLAWLIAAANILEIDLEVAVLRHYANGCGWCKLPVCDCSIVEDRPDGHITKSYDVPRFV